MNLERAKMAHKRLYTLIIGAGPAIIGLRPYRSTILWAIAFYLWHRLQNSARRS